MITLDRSNLASFISDDDRARVDSQVSKAQKMLLEGSGDGSGMLGWHSMLLDPDLEELSRIEEIANEIRSRADVLLCIGIGGSYLGAEAVMEALRLPFEEQKPEVIFAGHHLSPSYHERLLAYLEDKSVYVNVISKSGATLEPALAFRFVREFMERRFEDADRRIIATTDAQSGILKNLSNDRGYRTFVVPDDVGGRFSVLTPVGLLPIAADGHDIRSLLASATEVASSDNEVALAYAQDRFILHEAGYTNEIMAVFEPRLAGFGAWWQQLYGESEGKDHKGLFPSVVQYTTDLHSVGQYVQDGQRKLIETFLLANGESGLKVIRSQSDVDGLSDLVGKTYNDVNAAAYAGTAEAHTSGGVPNMTFRLEGLNEKTLGEALYTFEHAVAVSGYLLGVNPFDQPGVEAYKRAMYAFLGR
ncbi:glucose-6-phosphate isomerase [soil metagenome]